MEKKKIGVIVGSLRKNSYSQSVADCVTKLAPADFDMQQIEIGNLPLYNQDFDGRDDMEEYNRFRKTIKSLDAVLFITPEHNRSVPAALKNALDVGSRPYGASSWSGKPGAVISQSYGVIGGFGANHHLRQVLSFLDIHTMGQPECYLSEIQHSLNENGDIVSERTIDFLQSYMQAFENWVNQFVEKK